MPQAKLAPSAARLWVGATSGDPEAQWALGEATWKGHLEAEGLPRDPAAARAWLEAAAAKGHACALERLGFADLGFGFGLDPKAPKPCALRATQRLEAAAAAGAEGCLLWLGERFAGPDARNLPKALAYLRQAAVRAPRAGDRQAALERLQSLQEAATWEAGLEAVATEYRAKGSR